MSQQGGVPGGGVSVTKPLQISVGDRFTGTPTYGGSISIFSEDGLPLETLTWTSSDNTAVTSKAYASGTVLHILLETATDQLEWVTVTVPTMTAADAQANTYNLINVETNAAPASPIMIIREGATTLEDTDIWNYSSNTRPTFTVQYINTADNSGFANSYNPVMKQNLRLCVIVRLSGTGAENIVPVGFDYVYTVGMNTYGVLYLSPTQCSRWVVAGAVRPGYEGTQTRTFTLDLSGYEGEDGATMTVMLYAYADPVYASTHGGALGDAAYQVSSAAIGLDCS